MVRIPRRTHSVSGLTSVHCEMKDVACCCNMPTVHQFSLSMTELRRNPQRKCKKEEVPATHVDTARVNVKETKAEQTEPAKVTRNLQRKPPTHQQRHLNQVESFRFFDLPREVRDHVYSYLVIRRGRRTPILEAKSILRRQKKRATAQRTRERLNQKRIQSGRRPTTLREPITEPIIHLNVLQASKLLQYEASDYMYQSNWFAITLDNFPVTTINTPLGWDYSRITKMQLELQLKDSQRMNSYVDWATFFASFPALRFLRIIPTFHPRYYDWAQAEFRDWNSAHFIFRAFFRELLASIPQDVHLKLGPSLNPKADMHLEGRAPVSTELLQQMYAELGTRRGLSTREHGGSYLAVRGVVDCNEMLGGV